MATKPLSGPHAELAPGRIAAIMDTSDLATLLRDLRRRQARQRGDAELTYRALAARTGWSTGILTGYFTGRILPPTDRFDTLVALLDATPAEQGALATARDRVQELRRRAAPAGRPGR
ncbi:MAG TPA: helix-turn-helix transcriptional regulator, partial [Pilimelia sp.]|nr:helix-turn-helix transcriptional regulator [Pilimelia sp.]